MIIEVSSRKVVTSRIHHILANKEENKLTTRANLVRLYDDISRKIGGPIPLMSYWGSAGDALPIVCADTLVMVDNSAFVGADDVYHEAVELAKRDPSRSINIESENIKISHAKLSDYHHIVSTLSDVKLKYYQTHGFQPVGVPFVLPHILGSLKLLGIEPKDIDLKFSQDNTYELSFLYRGQRKKIIYLQAELKEIEGRQKTVDLIRGLRREEKNTLGAFVKGDQNNINKNMVPDMKPTVVVYDVGNLFEQAHEYSIQEFGGNDIYGSIKFGYCQSPKKLKIAKRIV